MLCDVDVFIAAETGSDSTFPAVTCSEYTSINTKSAQADGSNVIYCTAFLYSLLVAPHGFGTGSKSLSAGISGLLHYGMQFCTHEARSEVEVQLIHS